MWFTSRFVPLIRVIYDLPSQTLILNARPRGHKRCSKEGPERRLKKIRCFGDILQVIFIMALVKTDWRNKHLLGWWTYIYIYYVWWRRGSRVWAASHKLCSTLSLIRKIFKPLLSIIAVIEFPQTRHTYIYIYIHSVLLDEKMNWSKTSCYCLWYPLVICYIAMVFRWP